MNPDGGVRHDSDDMQHAGGKPSQEEGCLVQCGSSKAAEQVLVCAYSRATPYRA